MKLLLGVVPRIKEDAPFPSSERHVMKGILQGHEGSEILHFLFIDGFMEADPSLIRTEGIVMLHSECRDPFDTAVLEGDPQEGLMYMIGGRQDRGEGAECLLPRFTLHPGKNDSSSSSASNDF